MKRNIECAYCNGTAILESEDKVINYKKQLISVKAYYYQCPACREDFTTTEADTLTMMKLFNV